MEAVYQVSLRSIPLFGNSWVFVISQWVSDFWFLYTKYYIQTRIEITKRWSRFCKRDFSLTSWKFCLTFKMLKDLIQTIILLYVVIINICILKYSDMHLSLHIFHKINSTAVVLNCILKQLLTVNNECIRFTFRIGSVLGLFHDYPSKYY